MRAWSRKGLITGSTINEVISNRYRTFLECDHDSPCWGRLIRILFCNYFKFITLRSAVVADPSPFAGRRPSPRAPPLSPP